MKNQTYQISHTVAHALIYLFLAPIGGYVAYVEWALRYPTADVIFKAFVALIFYALTGAVLRTLLDQATSSAAATRALPAFDPPNAGPSAALSDPVLIANHVRNDLNENVWLRKLAAVEVYARDCGFVLRQNSHAASESVPGLLLEALGKVSYAAGQTLYYAEAFCSDTGFIDENVASAAKDGFCLSQIDEVRRALSEMGIHLFRGEERDWALPPIFRDGRMVLNEINSRAPNLRQDLINIKGIVSGWASTSFDYVRVADELQAP